MLLLSPLREGHHHHQLKDEKQLGDDGDVESSFAFNGGNNTVLDFPEFSGGMGMGNLLDSIDFDDLFIGIHDGDVLPDLEMDSEILDFSVPAPADDINTKTTPPPPSKEEEEVADDYYNTTKTRTTSSKVEDQEEEDLHGHGEVAAAAVSITSTNNNSGLNQNYSSSTTTTTPDHRGDQEIVSKRDDINQIRAAHRPSSGSTRRKSADHKLATKSSPAAQSKKSHGKRKVKKYRSHRKHLLAREAEAASWTQRRQMYGAVAAAGGGAGAKSRRDVMMMNNPNWLNAPTMGFPSITSTTPPPMHHAQHYHQLIRPLHVWGHPTMDQSMMHTWPPKHHLPHHFPSPVLPPPPPAPAHAWPPGPPPPPDASYWHHPHSHHQRALDSPTPGAPCFPRQQLLAPTQRFPTPPVPGIPPHAMYKVEPAGIAAPTPPQSGPHLLLDFHPSKESIDAAIGDVLSKPWLPLPLGLRPPATDTVMVELQRQGVQKFPPSCT
ncbi:probable transcription factor GLK1 isoform X5 [Malus domestica]|uniref:probable transcription factor GLK1 isoform X5 n=1 Tax=Malus domestica TaxID=3750 RepID=UPI003975F555